MSETYPAIALEPLAAGVWVLRFARPEKRNALDDAMVDELYAALAAIASNPDCRVVILTGAGSAFCAGFDLSLVQDKALDARRETIQWALRQERFAGLVTGLRALRQPVIAAVNGAASGAGFGLALAADIRLAGRSARFNAAFVRIGLSSCDIGLSWLLPRCVGLSRAFEIMLTGRFVDAVEADRIGLVSELVDDNLLLERAVAMAEAIAANSEFGVWMTKRGMWANVETPGLQAAIELENRTQILARSTGDMQAAMDARSKPK
jgi:enoyl-CoA hydratase